jgi:hypothetical protein
MGDIDLMRIEGNDSWRADPTSNDYDHKLIAIRLQHLRTVRDNRDVSSMLYILRAGKSNSKCRFEVD